MNNTLYKILLVLLLSPAAASFSRGERVIKNSHVQVVKERLRSAYGYYFKVYYMTNSTNYYQSFFSANCSPWFFGVLKKYPESLEDLTEKLLFCGKRDHLITVFNINCERDLDLTILSALLKGLRRESEQLMLIILHMLPHTADFWVQYKYFGVYEFIIR